jgi:Tol biopolymer transport system component
MNGITHKRAKRYMHAELDGLLTDIQRCDLDTHLRECEACRVESESLSLLTARLRGNFQARWDTQDGPSQNVVENIHSQTRRIIMSNRIRFGLRTLAGIGALIVLGFLINFAFAQLRNTSVAVSGIEATGGVIPEKQSPLIAFVSDQNGNSEIYTVNTDGTHLTNLTNNPATDTSPAWSPDGTHIAFNSDRRGDMDIYVMDADGSNVKRLTDDRGFEGLLSWSPDGQRIVFTSSDNSLNYDGQLIVMNADGGNEIILTPEPGTYYFLGWSPDGQKIIFEYFYGNSKDNRIVAASVDGTGAELLGPYFEGDNGRLHRQIHWEAPDQFITISSNSERPTWGWWNLTRFSTTGDSMDDNGSGPIILTSDNPIVAIFDHTYVVESTDSLSWFPYSGEPFPLSPWNFNERCTEAGRPNLQETEHTVSPSGKQAFVTVHCNEGVTWFYLENSDGSQFVQLTDFSVPDPSRVIDTSWSPDGKYVTVIIYRFQGNQYIGVDLYLFDIEKMLKDPSVKPIQLTTDGAMKYGAVWQPVTNNKIVKEKPTPGPLSFSLNTNEAETLAGFDVLEPSYLPTGYTLEGVAYDPQTQKVAIKYNSQQNDGTLFIYQQRGDLLNYPDVRAYVTPVPRGDTEGEFLRGAWIYESPDTTTPRWDATAETYSLTWQMGEIFYTITFIGGETIPPILMDDLMAIAKNMK